MKISILHWLCLGLIWLIGSSALTPRSMSPVHSHPAGGYYYWYDYPDDDYINLQTTDEEIRELEESYGVIVNTVQSGGTLLERGYINSTYPHNNPIFVFLYGHF